MTDAERTPEQGAASEQTEQTGGGLLSRLMDKAKGVAGTVVDTAKEVVESVSERATSVVAPVMQRAGEATTAAPSNGEAAHQPSARPVRARVYGAVSVAAESVGSVAETVGDTAQAAAEVVSDTVSTATDAVTATASTAAEAVTGTVSTAVDGVRARLARVYEAVTGDKGASYEPPAEAEKPAGRPRRFKDITPGMQLDGKVTSIALYGIFVDVGVGRDGLVHISEMSDKRIESPTDLVQIGTPVQVWVKSVDPEARRISLTMRDPNRAKPERTERRQPRKPEVNRERLASLKAGDAVEGTVSSVAPFGAFVDIGAGKDGLVHISELAEGRVERPEDAVTVGQTYTFKILEVDPDGNRISLSLRRAQRTQRMQQLEPGTVLDGTISGIAPFGAFVDIGVGRDGLVHVSELSPDRVNRVEDVVKVGDKVQVKVIEVDPNSKRISLTMRVDEPAPTERPRPASRPPTAEGAPSFGGPSNFGGPPPAAGGGERRTFGDSSTGGSRSFGARPAFGEGGDQRGRSDRRGERDRGDRTGFVDERAPARRDRGADRGDRGGRGGGARGGGRRDNQAPEGEQEVYSFGEQEEEFTGDASLQDLLSKFNQGKGRDNRRKSTGSNTEDDDDQQRSDAIRRTLAMRQDEE